MPEENSTQPNINNKERLIGIVDRLKPNVDLMERFVGLIKKYQGLLSEPKLLFKYKKEWIALLIAFRLYNQYKSGSIREEEVRDYMKQIASYDNGLAGDIRKLLPAINNQKNVFSDLISAYSRGAEYFIAYITTNTKELIARAKSVKNVELSKKLVALFSSISGHEAVYIGRYRADCENWTNIRYLNYGIEYFRGRIDLYLKGGFEENTQFMGLYRNFGDEKIMRAMLDNREVRNLWRYREQINYLNILIWLCRKSETSNEWEGFWGEKFWGENKADDIKNVGFWGKKGDEKGRNFDKHAELLETKYGNTFFARVLKAKKDKIGENPEGWGGLWQGDKLVRPGFLHQLLATLQNPQYYRPKIIDPASKGLSQIFKKREDELLADKQKDIAELVKVLWDLSGLGVDITKVIKKFKRLLEKRKWKLSKNAERETDELVSNSTSPLIAYGDFSRLQEKVMAKADLDFRVNRMKKLALIAISSSKYKIMKQKTDDFLNDLGGLVGLDRADGLVAEASLKIDELMEFRHLNENDFKEMEMLVTKSIFVVRALRNFAAAYLKKELDEKFTITVDEVENLPINVISTQQKAETNQKKEGIPQENEYVPRAA